MDRPSKPIFEFDDFRLDPSEHLLLQNGRPLRLTPKAFETLLLLVRNNSHIITKEELLKKLWPDSFVEESNLNFNISRIRKALGDSPDAPKYIERVPKVWFRFVARVRVLGGPAGKTLPEVFSRPVWGNRAVLGVLGIAVSLLLVLAVLFYFREEAGVTIDWWRSRGSSENPLANARISRFTDLEGNEIDAAISPDGKFVVFLSDREGLYDVWGGHVGGGEFINLTKGRFERMQQDGHRTAGFSADGTHVWFRAFERDSSGQDVPSVWLVPSMGGTPRRFLEKAVHVAWSPDGTRIVYHEFTPGDPMFIADPNGSNPRRLFVDQPGRHCQGFYLLTLLN